MDPFLSLVAMLGLCGLLALMAVWSRKETRARLLALSLLILAVPAAATTVAYTTGTPRPLWVEGKIGPRMIVLGYKLDPGVAIYVLLDAPGKPLYVRMPWNEPAARKLQELMQEGGPGAEMDGGDMQGGTPYPWSWDRNPPQFHPRPQRPQPSPKRKPDGPPVLDF